MTTRVDKLADEVIEQRNREKSARKNWDITWDESARYVLPRKATFTTELEPGTVRSHWILDDTAPRALELFASFMFTLLNNPALQWFHVMPRNRQLQKDQENLTWLEDVEQTMLDHMGSTNSDVYSALLENYRDIGAFGTTSLFTDIVRQNVRYREYGIHDVFIQENDLGKIDTVYRDFKYSPRQMQQRWPKLDPALMGGTVESATDKKNLSKLNEPQSMIHAVLPTEDLENFTFRGKARLMGSGMPFASVWVNKKDRKVLQTAGYEEFPYAVPRWYRTRGEKYGRSTTMTMLPSIRMANRMKETIIRAMEKAVDPPLLLQDGSLVTPIRVSPGAVTFAEGAVNPQPLIPTGSQQFAPAVQLLGDTQNSIREGYFIPLFITPDSPVKTATQVLQEADERNKAASPMLMRIQTELLQPVILRTFKIMERAGMFPPPPPGLVEEPLEVVYQSPLTAAQHQADGLAMLRLFESLAPWASTPDGQKIFDRYDLDEVERILHQSSAAPQSVRLGDTRMKQSRQSREQAEEQTAATGTALQAAEVAAKFRE